MIPEKAEWHVPIFKDESRQIVYGVVLTPGLEDSQGDIVSAQDIEKAAHRWMTEHRKQDIQHDGKVTKGSGGLPIAEPVESYIAPVDFEMGGQTVLKGSWVLATHVNDSEEWQRVLKGELGGYSIQGTGNRTEIVEVTV